MKIKLLYTLTLLVSLALPLTGYAKHKMAEKDYQEKECTKWGGKLEYRIKRKKSTFRVDCLTDISDPHRSLLLL